MPESLALHRQRFIADHQGGIGIDRVGVRRAGVDDPLNQFLVVRLTSADSATRMP